MPIPDFNPDGLLPAGLYVCTLSEVEERCGRFRTTSQRPELFARLRSYVAEAQGAGVVRAIAIDGSFVTAVDHPNDVDLIVVLGSDYDVGAPLRPAVYNALSSRRIRHRFGFDAFTARDGSAEYTEYIAFYQQVRGRPGVVKGILRVDL